jgi:hypothetical protein
MRGQRHIESEQLKLKRSERKGGDLGLDRPPIPNDSRSCQLDLAAPREPLWAGHGHRYNQPFIVSVQPTDPRRRSSLAALSHDPPVPG